MSASLTSYGGVYDDPKLEALIGKTVDRLVAVSDRPEQAYRVTILNSGAVNAFALPTGQLYVTRGLVALASDTSELSSVLSHEMAHVLAKHASMREDQARQAAVVTRVVTDMSNDPDFDRAGAGQDQADDGELLARPGVRGRRHRRRHLPPRAQFDPYGAARFLSAMERNAALKAGKTSLDPRAQDFLSSHPATPERVQNAQTSARQYGSPQSGERDRETYLAAIDNIVYGEDPSEGFVRGRRFLHPKLGFTFAAPDTFTLDNTAQAVIGVRDGGTQAMRFDVVRVPAEQSLRRLSQFRLDGECRQGLDRGVDHQRFSGGVRHRPRRPVALQGLCAALRQRRLSLHLRLAAEDPPRASATRARPSIPSAA